MAEELMYSENADVLIVYDDLTKHTPRPIAPYPFCCADLRAVKPIPAMFSICNSRLLERAARLSDEKGGGSITALPIVETQGGDISAYIPTNVISITDGPDLSGIRTLFLWAAPCDQCRLVGFPCRRQRPVEGNEEGGRPASNQSGAISANWKRFPNSVPIWDESTRSQLVKGRNLYEILKQSQYSPIPMEEQVVILYLANTNKFASFDKEDIKPFFKRFVDYLKSIYPQVLAAIRETGGFTPETQQLIDNGYSEYYQSWKAEHEDYGTII